VTLTSVADRHVGPCDHRLPADELVDAYLIDVLAIRDGVGDISFGDDGERPSGRGTT